MRKRHVYLIVIAVAVLVGCFVAVLLFSRQPSYHGRPLEVWIRLQFAPPANGQAAEAIRRIGTNGFPYLLKWVRYETPPWKTKLADVLYPILMRHQIPWLINVL